MFRESSPGSHVSRLVASSSSANCNIHHCLKHNRGTLNAVKIESSIHFRNFTTVVRPFCSWKSVNCEDNLIFFLTCIQGFILFSLMDIPGLQRQQRSQIVYLDWGGQGSCRFLDRLSPNQLASSLSVNGK